MRAALLILLAAALLLSAAVGEAEVYRVPLKCPYCGNSFDALQSPDTKYDAGVDSDFCSYSRSGSTRSFEIAACPKCGYSGIFADVLSGAALDEKKKAGVSEVLKELWDGPYPQSDDIPIHLKFEIALAIAEKTGATPLEMGKLAHLAAWSIRDKIVFRAIRDEYRNPARAFESFDRLSRAFQPTAKEDLATAFELLHLSVRLGLPASRSKIVRQTLDLSRTLLGAEDRKTLEASISDFSADCARERRFMARCAVLYESALASSQDLPSDERQTLIYLIGELHRRCGEPQKAEVWFNKAVAESPRADIKALVPVLLKRMEKWGEADLVSWPKTLCPLCGKETYCFDESEPDYMGGTDTDFCSHSLVPSAYSTQVIVCLNCLYANWRKDFPKVLSESQKATLNEALKDKRAELKPSSPISLRGWDPFELTAISLQSLNADPTKVGMAWLNAAWAARRAFTSPALELGFGEEMLMPSFVQEQIDKVDDGTFAGYYLSACLASRGGLVKLRDKYLAKAAGMTLDEEGRKALVNSAKRIAEEEKRFLAVALEQFQKVSAQTPDYEFYLFLTGDIQRRLGRSRDARSIFKKCVDFERVGPIARELLSDM
ncbi:MAG: hypothetical protein Kow00107_08890 [Planctomycetota bacterium]